MNDSFGDLIKSYENVESARTFDPSRPVIVRLDGKAFHTLTKGFDKPFCNRFANWMQDITKNLVEQSDALIGYTQSDEITLVFYREDQKREMYFGGRIQKLCSVLASMATMYGMKNISQLPSIAYNRNIMFDCRAFQVETTQLATFCVSWRILDAYRNAVNAISQAHFTHKQLLNKSSDEKLEMLGELGITLNNFSHYNVYGTLFKRTSIARKFTTHEIDALPEKHKAKYNPDLIVERSMVLPHDAPIVTGDLHELIFGEKMYVLCGTTTLATLHDAGFPT